MYGAGMELLIALGIGVIGYRLAGDPSPPRHGTPGGRKHNTRPDAWPPGDKSSEGIRRDSAARARRAFRDSLRPRQTGVINPVTVSQQPFFRSQGKQNTNEKVKQTRMELFTGGVDAGASATGTYRRKRETEAFFKPRETAATEPVSFSGSTGLPPADLAAAQQRTWVSRVQNNVLPAPQVRVGPGLGLGPDQLTGCDGFHPMLRVMPRNVNEYRKNNLPGSVNAGAAPVKQRDTAPGQATRMPGETSDGPVFWDMERRPLQPTRAAVTAPSATAVGATAFPRDGSTAAAQRPLAESYVGAPTAVCGVSGPIVDQMTATRAGNDSLGTLPMLNVTSAAAGPAPGGAAPGGIAGVDSYRYDATQREVPNAHVGAVGGWAHVGAEARVSPAPGPTLRDLSNVDGLGKPTVQAVQTSQRPRPQDAPATTLRELSSQAAHVLNPKTHINAEAAHLAAQQQPLDREAKRWAYSDQTGTRAGPGRMNVRADAAHTLGAMAVRDDDTQAPDAVLPTVPVPAYDSKPGALTTPFNKLPVHNPRLDLGVAAAQLADNPLANTWSCK